MEYENKEAKKFVQWFLLCSVIILLLTGTVTTLVVRNYRARENEAVTAMLGIVLKTMAVTQRNPDRKNLRVHAHVRAPACISEIPSERDKRSRKNPAKLWHIRGGTGDCRNKTMERRILLGTLGGVLLAELAAGGLFFIYQKRRSRKLAELSDYMEEIVRGHYDLALADNTEDELSHLKNQLYKITLFLKEESDHAKEKRPRLQNRLRTFPTS